MAEQFVDDILADLQRTVGAAVSDYFDLTFDRFTRQTFQHTHMFPYELDQVIDEAIREVYIPPEFDHVIDSWNEICNMIRYGLPIGLLCMAQRLANDEMAGWTVVDAMALCMRRVRTSGLPQRLIDCLN